MEENRDDFARDKILRFLYEKRRRRTKGFKTTEIEKALKPVGVKQSEVRANLPYLEDLDWIVKETSERQYRGAQTFQSSPEIRYRISANGVNMIDGMGSPYSQNQGKYTGIHIANVTGTVILGDHNVVSTKATAVVKPLEKLVSAVETSDELSDEEKFDLTSDLATLRAALTRREPNRGIIRTVIDSLKIFTDMASIGNLIHAVIEALKNANLF